MTIKPPPHNSPPQSKQTNVLLSRKIFPDSPIFIYTHNQSLWPSYLLCDWFPLTGSLRFNKDVRGYRKAIHGGCRVRSPPLTKLRYPTTWLPDRYSVDRTFVCVEDPGNLDFMGWINYTLWYRCIEDYRKKHWEELKCGWKKWVNFCGVIIQLITSLWYTLGEGIN